jgi:hypothetical protein
MEASTAPMLGFVCLGMVLLPLAVVSPYSSTYIYIYFKLIIMAF